jgi:hypothetical protein
MGCEYLSLKPDPDLGRIINDVSFIYYSDADKTFKYTTWRQKVGHTKTS